MVVLYQPKGVCSQRMLIDVEDGILRTLKVEGGCNGNLQGIAKLVEGMPVNDIISRLDGIQCGVRKTSCPDQLVQALKKIEEKNKEA